MSSNLNSHVITVNIPQPTTLASKPQDVSNTIANHRHWQSNICDCCVDCSSCCLSFTCPCVTFCKVVNHVNEGKGSCCKGLCCFVLPCSVFLRAPYRKQLRVKHNLPAKPCNDCCVAFWCPCCALAQELREIKHQTNLQPPKMQAMMF